MAQLMNLQTNICFNFISMINNIFLQHCCLFVHYPVCPSKTGLDANNNQENLYFFLPRSFHYESNNQLEIEIISEKKFKTEAGENCFRLLLCLLAIILLCIASRLGRSTGDLHFTLRMVIGSPPLCRKCTFFLLFPLSPLNLQTVFSNL